MMNFNNKKTQKTIAAVISLLLVFAMILPMVLSYLE